MRKKVIAGNWKMFKTVAEARSFLTAFIPLVEGSSAQVLFAVPFTALHAAVQAVAGSKIVIGAQNMHDAKEGAFTGEISSSMLKEAGAQFVLLGHSERRAIFHESNEFIQRKVKSALAAGIKVILCIGESESEREAGKTEEVLRAQLDGSLPEMQFADLDQLTIAYEPVWAIGTGKSATAAMAQEAHRFCRMHLGKKWGEERARRVALLYGGSVKPENCKEILAQPDIDGALVGGASLDPQVFAKIALSS